MLSLSISSPVGDLVLDDEGGAIVAIRWASSHTDAVRASNGSALLAEAARQLEAYFAGRLSHFDLPLHLAGSDFERRVWAQMQTIPYGKTRSYGDLAEAIGSAPRAVGGACGKNPIPIVIPCHRVLSKTGLGGYSGAGGVDTKQTLLALEGALG
jgi:methylated-DNA-[protein]-cysteine S-methyltransferase